MKQDEQENNVGETSFDLLVIIQSVIMLLSRQKLIVRNKTFFCARENTICYVRV